MYIIYCLTNESLRETILSVGITHSFDSLDELLEDINTTFLPTPYTILTAKRVSNENSIDNVYALLSKFGKYLQGTFFEIPPITVIQIFDLIHDDIQEKYRVVQAEVEYIIPKAADCVYQVPAPNAIYDRLSFSTKRVKMDDIDL